MLCFDTKDEAKEHYKFIKDYFLNDSLSIDIIEENILEFVGGQDYTIKVKKYDEQIIDQFVDDWIDRFVHLSQMFLDIDSRNALQYNLIKDIEAKLEGYQNRYSQPTEIKSFTSDLLGMIKVHKIMQDVQVENNLLAQLNQKVMDLSKKLDDLNK